MFNGTSLSEENKWLFITHLNEAWPYNWQSNQTSLIVQDQNYPNPFNPTH